MKPLFTIHAGEYLTAEHIEREYPHLHVWVPTRDVGIDLLVTNPRTRKQLSLQVKYSRDFRVTHVAAGLQPKLRACGWWTLHAEKIAQSPADYWVMVLYGLARGSIDYIVIKPSELLARLRGIHGDLERLQTYLWTTEGGRCWETRGLKKQDHQAVADASFHEASRDFTPFLENWACLKDLG
jgi:hypothetical protein